MSYRALLIAILSVSLTACSSGSGSGSSGSDPTTITATVVDPYIEGAVFCILSNPTPSGDLGAEEKQQCADDDVRSTPSGADGVITFEIDGALPANTLIIADKPGTHNGVAYPVDMAALLDDGAELGDHFIISPMTTVRGRTAQIDQNGAIVDKLSPGDIVAMLQDAGMVGITEADVSADPMEGMAELTSPEDDNDLVRIQSALAVYGLLLVYDQSVVLRGFPPQAFQTSDEIAEILAVMVQTIQGAVNSDLIAKVQEPITAANEQLANAGVPSSHRFPDVSAEVLINGSVSVMDKIGAETATATKDAFDNGKDNWHQIGLQTADGFLTYKDDDDDDEGFSRLLWEQGISYYGSRFADDLQGLLDYYNMGPGQASSMAELMGPHGAAEEGALMDIGMACAAEYTGYFKVVRENPNADEGDENRYALEYSCIKD